MAYVFSDPSAARLDGGIPYRLGVASRARGSDGWHTAEPSLPVTKTGSDDKPVILADASATGFRFGRVYVAWSRRDTFARADSGEILASSSDDNGQTWSRPTQVSAGFGWGVHLAIGPGGALYVGWWDPSGALVAVRSNDGGASFGPPRRIVSLLLPGAGSGYVRAQLRPVMPDPALAASSGSLYLAYSRPTAHGRRIYLVRLDGSLRVRKTRILRPSVAGTYDEFNPSIALDPVTGHIWSCFYVTGSRGKAKYATYSCARSVDAGRHWTPVRRVAGVASNETQPGSYATPSGVEGQYGAYDGLAVFGGFAHPIWTDSRRFKLAREEVYTRTLRG